MSRKSILSSCFVLALSLMLTSVAAADPNLVGYWKFDGNADDSSGYGRHGTLMGNPSFVNGVFDQALDTSADAGDPEYVEIMGYKGISNGNPFTVAAWINTTDNGVMVGWGVVRGPDDGRRMMEFRLESDTLEIHHGAGHCDGTTVVTDGEWHHVAVTVARNATVSPAQTKLYVDGEPEIATSNNTNPYEIEESENVTISREQGRTDRWLDALIDEVRIYDRELSAAEIEILARPPYASRPSPEDDSVHGETSVILRWTPGALAAEVDGHQVFFGDNFADVNTGVGDTYKGRQSNDFYLVTGLELGMTYYWRIDEVNESQVWKGQIWSFTVPDITAWRPDPPDGLEFVRTDATLNWEAGLDAFLHDVYFGKSFDDVNAGTGDTFKGQILDPTYDPGPLDPDTVYYWRVDETKTDATVERGPVWSFKTMPPIPIVDPNLILWYKFDEGMGTSALDWSGHGNHGTVRGDTQWVAGFDGGALSFDGSLDYVAIENLTYQDTDLREASVAAWIRTTNSGGQTIVSFDRSEYWRLDVDVVAATDPGEVGWCVMTILNASETQIDLASRSRVDNGQWRHVAGVYRNGTLTLYIDGNPEVSASGGGVFGTGDLRYGFVGVGSEATEFDGAVTPNYFLGEIDDVRIYDKALTQAEIAEAMRGDPLLAW
ncbi:MAG: LamG domain-containing protein, partial [Phycisphaerales bacterium]